MTERKDDVGTPAPPVVKVGLAGVPVSLTPEDVDLLIDPEAERVASFLRYVREVCRCAGVLAHWCAGVLVCRGAGVLVSWYPGVLVSWCPVLVCWRAGVLVCCCVGVLVLCRVLAICCLLTVSCVSHAVCGLLLAVVQLIA